MALSTSCSQRSSNPAYPWSTGSPSTAPRGLAFSRRFARWRLAGLSDRADNREFSVLLALFLRLDRRTEGVGPRAQGHDLHLGALCCRDDRLDRRRRHFLRAEAVFCVWSWQLAELPALGWLHRNPSGGPADRGKHARHDRAVRAHFVFRRANPLRRAGRRHGEDPGDQDGMHAALPQRRRATAARGYRTLETADRRRGARRHRIERGTAHLCAEPARAN